MNVLLLNPEFPDTFWSFKHALRFVHKRAPFPPLGLLTVAAMLPEAWTKRVVDVNVRRLREADLRWADCVLISAMDIQRRSAAALITRAKAAGRTVIAGGPLFSSDPEAFPEVDHLVLNEAEVTLPEFLADWARGAARRVYRTDSHPPLDHTPVPLWGLADMKRYAAMSIQYSRGCPFNCDFCNVTALLGHRVRAKSSAQVIAELESLRAHGWRGQVFFVDDNLIGNRRRLAEDLLPALIAWQHRRPGFTFHTEASINLADDEPLMRQMVQAGFNMVFIGIETPEEASLAECSKRQNARRDLVADVKRIQRAGLQVQGGFIVGFDSDPPTIFRRQIEFIQQSGIVTAMVGLLQAPAGTRLYERLRGEGRLLGRSSGDNVDGSTNIVPRMSIERLREGYKEILAHIYAPRHYYQRVRTFLHEYRAPDIRPRVSRADISAFIQSLYRLGLFGRERLHYWKLVFWTGLRRPHLFPLAITLAIYGYHFRRVCERHVL